MVLVYDWRPVLEAGWWRLGIGPLSSRAGHNGTMAGLRSLRSLAAAPSEAGLCAGTMGWPISRLLLHRPPLPTTNTAEVTQKKKICNLQENCDYNSVIIHINFKEGQGFQEENPG